jgi:hypothetical protein
MFPWREQTGVQPSTRRLACVRLRPAALLRVQRAKTRDHLLPNLATDTSRSRCGPDGYWVRAVGTLTMA